MISVIVPVYNCEKNLERCVQSILSQSEQEIEIILVNDGSTDGSYEICEKYAKEHAKVRVIHQENGGVSKARNTGIRAAKGKYIQFVDSDDYLEKDMCRYMKACMQEKQADLVIAGFHHHYMGRDIVKVPNIHQEPLAELNCFESSFLNLYEEGFLNMPWNKLYKKEKMIELFPENLSLGEDLLFNISYLKTLKNTDNIFIAQAPLYHYIQERENVTLSSKKRENKVEIATKICRATEDFYHNNLGQSGGESRIYSRLISEYLCDLAESVYDKTITYEEFHRMAAKYTDDAYVKKVNHHITNLPLDLKVLNYFFQKGNIKPLWYLCYVRKLAVNILTRTKG